MSTCSNAIIQRIRKIIKQSKFRSLNSTERGLRLHNLQAALNHWPLCIVAGAQSSNHVQYRSYFRHSPPHLDF